MAEFTDPVLRVRGWTAAATLSYALALSLGLLLLGAGPRLADAAAPGAEPLPGSYEARLLALWSEERRRLAAELRADLSAGDTGGLYRVQIGTAPLMTWGARTMRASTLEELADVLGVAFDHVRTTRTLAYHHLEEPPTDVAGEPVDGVTRVTFEHEVQAWLSFAADGEVLPESVLDSAQFLYALARLSRALAQVGSGGVEASSFRARSWSLVVDHLRRWVDPPPGIPGAFQRAGWGCARGNFSHAEHVERLLRRAYGRAPPTAPESPRPGYCDVITDRDLFVVMLAAEALVLRDLDPQRFELDAATAETLGRYVERAVQLLESRTGTTLLDGPDDTIAMGAIVDRGGWDDYPDFAYSAHDGRYPGWVEDPDEPALPERPASWVGWDISHARRFVLLLDTMEALEGVEDVRGLAHSSRTALGRQLVLGPWNGSLSRPGFSNFVDGTNGWYRVNYAGRAGYGFAPHELGERFVAGGYGALAALDDGVRRVLGATLRADERDVQARARADVESLGWLASAALVAGADHRTAYDPSSRLGRPFARMRTPGQETKAATCEIP